MNPDFKANPHLITGKCRVVAVWGHPVGHSMSPIMHNAAYRVIGLDWVYVPFDVAPDQLEDAVRGVRAMGFVGVNCTVPLKEQVGRFLDAIDPDAERICSVNTVVNDGGVLTGYSTDGPGLMWDLERVGMKADGKRVLIWGAGGTARAVAYALSQRGCSVVVANRTRSRAQLVAALCDGAVVGLDGEEYCAAVGDAELLINTTTLGMHGEGMPPLPEGALHAAQCVYDVVYSPPVTPLLAHANAAGCRTSNGLGMLVCQGALSLARWTGLAAEALPIEVMSAAIRA